MPSVREYSIMKMGNGGMVVSLPRSWARYYKLRPGDKVEIIADGSLIIKPKKEEGKTLLNPLPEG